MIQFKPFKGIRPATGKGASVTTKNAEYCSEEEVNYALNNNPESFFNIINPQHKDFSTFNYEQMKEKLQQFIKERILVKDPSSYYIYEQEIEKNIKILGIVGLISIEDYNNGIIKKHEKTLKEKETVFTNYLKSVHLQPDPVLLTFQSDHNIEVLLSMAMAKTPTLEFVGSDKRTHKLWQVKDRLIMQQLKSFIEKQPALYIADGHHRLESSAQYTQYRKENEIEYIGTETYNYALSIVIPGNYLQIYDYNRLLKDLNGLSKETFLQKLEKVFNVIEKKEPYYPSNKHHLSMYLDGKFYALYVRHEYRGTPKALGELDTYLWEKHIMRDILGIEDVPHSNKVEFFKGTGNIQGILKMKEKVDTQDFAVSFGFYPIAIKDLILVADEDKKMPAKSTYIYPKFLSALIMLDLND